MLTIASLGGRMRLDTVGSGVALEEHMAEPSGKIMTIEELAEYLKISRSTLYKLLQDGKLPGQKVGKRWRFHQDAIDEWVKSGTGTVASHKTGQRH